MLTKSLEQIKLRTAVWLLRGVSPRRLALTLALGFAFGCIPVFGVPTTLCIATALVLRLNLPVLQAANYAAMPFQVLFMLPLFRLGSWLFAGVSGHRQVELTAALLHRSPSDLLAQAGGLAGHAFLAWMLIAVPAIALMTAAFTVLLRRVPAFAAAEAGD